MIENKLDLLLINTYDITTLAIADISIYDILYTVPTTAQIEITPPGFTKVIVDFNTKNVNIYRAIDLGLTCDETCMELPDGIYEVKYSTTGNNAVSVTKYFIRVDKLKNKYQSKFITIDMNCDCKNLEKDDKLKILYDISLLIEGSVASANMCDITSSKTLYQKAERMLDKLNCK